jgi:predicted acetyltransferase
VGRGVITPLSFFLQAVNSKQKLDKKMARDFIFINFKSKGDLLPAMKKMLCDELMILACQLRVNPANVQGQALFYMALKA